MADDALIYVRTTLRGRGHQRGSVALFQWLPETWRERLHVRPEHIVARGDILTYANPVVLDASDEGQHRVIDNPYIHSLLETSQPEKDA